MDKVKIWFARMWCMMLTGLTAGMMWKYPQFGITVLVMVMGSLLLGTTLCAVVTVIYGPRK
jgi:hypothetical protein